MIGGSLIRQITHTKRRPATSVVTIIPTSSPQYCARSRHPGLSGRSPVDRDKAPDQSQHHSHTLPYISQKPNALGTFSPTGWVVLWLLNIVQATDSGRYGRRKGTHLVFRPAGVLPLRLGRQAISVTAQYYHVVTACDVIERPRFSRALDRLQNATASNQLKLSTGFLGFPAKKLGFVPMIVAYCSWVTS